jgi:hypothetical protein
MDGCQPNGGAAGLFLLCGASRRQPEQLRRFDVQRVCDFAHDLQAGIEGAFLDLAQVAPADVRLIRKIVLRQPFGVAQAAHVCGEHIAEIHPRSQTDCSKCAPRFTEQKAFMNGDGDAAVIFAATTMSETTQKFG